MYFNYMIEAWAIGPPGFHKFLKVWEKKIEFGKKKNRTIIFETVKTLLRG